MAIDLIDSLKEGVGILKRKDDDIFDRLSNRYTVGKNIDLDPGRYIRLKKYHSLTVRMFVAFSFIIE